jgi:hypothetical protein
MVDKTVRLTDQERQVCTCTWRLTPMALRERRRRRRTPRPVPPLVVPAASCLFLFSESAGAGVRGAWAQVPSLPAAFQGFGFRELRG